MRPHERGFRLLRHPFFSDSAVFFVASSLINVLNYGFVLLAGHSLSKIEFGTFNALLGCVTISTVVAHPLELQVIRTVALSSGASARRYQRVLMGKAAGWSLGLLVPVGVVIPSLARLLSTLPADVLMTYLTVIALVFAALANGMTAGLRRMKLSPW